MIDRAIKVGKANSQKEIAEYVREKLEIDYSEGTVKLDIKRMREIYDAPIVYNTVAKRYTYGYLYEFSEAFVKYWSSHMVLSTKLSKILDVNV